MGGEKYKHIASEKKKRFHIRAHAILMAERRREFDSLFSSQSLRDVEVKGPQNGGEKANTYKKKSKQHLRGLIHPGGLKYVIHKTVNHVVRELQTMSTWVVCVAVITQACAFFPPVLINGLLLLH